VKYVSADAIRLILWVLGFMSFGFGTREFEVTMDRLGCYRPEEHIDNPKDYADNLDARKYDRRLRGPVDERRELSIDDRNGMKNYIASEDLGITTSAGMVRDLLRRCIYLARESKGKRDELEMYEALRLLGTATHCLEDFAAHSNYIELCLIEMNERNVFPHVGTRTQVQIRGARYPVFPIVTGTFGGVDFLHSVCGEVSDKITQSEIDELEGTMNNASQSQSVSTIKNLLSQFPPGLFGDDDHESKVDELSANSAAAQMQNMQNSPKQPEAFTRQAQMLTREIYPALEFHDNIMRSITEAIEQIPVLPDLIEQLQEQISIFVFSLIAPIIVPIIGQIKAEIATGSSEIISSSKDQQHVVFNNDQSTDPTHSMLSKDHFTNILNEPAGKTASQILRWAIPQIVDCWDNPNIDAERTINRIINGVFHHPVMREQDYDGSRDCRMQMFGVVEQWWQTKDEREKSDFREKLSRDGVLNGRNHKEGLHDKGHGCGKPLGFASVTGAGGKNMAIAGALMSGLQGALGEVTGGGSQSQGYGREAGGGNDIGNFASDVIGGGAIGDLVGGLVGGVGGSLLGGAFDEPDDQRAAYQQSYPQPGGGQTTTYMETAHRPAQYGQEDRYGQAAYSRTDFPGGQREEYRRYEQDGRQPQSGYGLEQSVETRRTEGGGYERREETKYERTGGEWASETKTEGYGASGDYYSETK
jgi:Heterokaryon incompatibility protein Het-C